MDTIMFSKIKAWWDNRIIAKSGISEQQWNTAFQQVSFLDSLSESERNRLKRMATLFLHEKTITGAHGLEITLDMMLVIALQACLPVLEIGLDWYDGWISVIVYPAGFVPEREYVDDNGLVHNVRQELSGESWLRGPVILSWGAVQHAGVIDGSNLVIHEFVHKLDMQNGVANGFPPLHDDMNIRKWSSVFQHAFDDFSENRHTLRKLQIDRYGATSPAEFLAVLSEVFFEKPQVVHERYPDVYHQLSRFYRQDPLGRIQGKPL